MKKLVFLSLTLWFSLSVFAQYENILIGVGPSEPSITMNPKNTNELVAGANIDNYYYSIDGGYNWTAGKLVSPENGVWGDPCMITDTAGDFYFLHLSNPASGSWIDRIVSQKYDLETDTWSNDSYMGLNGSKAQDKEWAVVDSATNTIYVTWTQFDDYGVSDPDKYSDIMFSKSVDAGASWSEALRINEVSGDCVDSDNTTEGAVPAVGPNGELYVAWSGPAGIVFDRSMDGGESWLENDIFINAQPGGWDYDIPGISRCNGLPVTCCDISNSPYKGHIYVNWTDQRSDDTDVWLAKSEDGGDTWSEAIRVNDDEAGKHQFFTWMTIDQTNGDLVMVFYDRRNYNDRNTDVYMATSNDGGQTFTNTLISESPFIPSSQVFFGDYTNVTAHNGIVRPIWIRAEGTSRSLWTALVDLSVDIKELETNIPFSLEQNYPNPFRESTYISFKLHEASKVTLSVLDIHGRQVATMINNRSMQAGKYTETFDSNIHQLTPGVYYFTLTSGEKLQKQKMLMLR